jgi:prepilin-type processing-associated H-X9-DG protein
VLAFERIGGHQHFGVNILFGDGHVDLMSIEPGTPERSRYNHLRADHAAGVRPLRLRP